MSGDAKAVSARREPADHARFIIDRHPDFQRVIIASPCSGHGFKHSAGVGELLAEMVTDGRKPDPRFALMRSADLRIRS